MERTESFGHRGTQFQWDPTQRLLSIRLAPELVDPDDVEGMMSRLTPWVDADPSGFCMLVDARQLEKVTLAWRTAWVPWFRERRARMKVAVFGASRIDSLTIPVFAWATGTDIRAFEDEGGARAWLAPSDAPEAF